MRYEHEKWLVEEVLVWLRQKEIKEEIVKKFEENLIKGTTLKFLTLEDLTEK
jgi:hypothetical protein